MTRRSDLKRLGTRYGGWVVPASLISSSSVCYSAGVGEDISFDLALIESFGCQVYAFDPTPRAIEYVRETVDMVPQFHFYDIGLWSKNETLKFYAPSNPRHVSHSIVNLQATSTFFEARCRSLSSLMEELGHSHIDLLKMDIEGAEYEVLTSIIDEQIPVAVICVEFDQPTPFSKTVRMVKSLSGVGYDLVSIDGWNYTFVQADVRAGVQAGREQ